MPEVVSPEGWRYWELDVLKNDSHGDGIGVTELTIIGLARTLEQANRGEFATEWYGTEWMRTYASDYVRISPDGTRLTLCANGDQTAPFDRLYYLATNGVATAMAEVTVDYNDR
ncbi:hypothetical protein ACFLS0_02635 [Candidatus Bipolaricaulota bacterium]